MYINTDKLKIITTLRTAKTITQGKFIVTYPFPLKKRREQIPIQLPSSEREEGRRRRRPGANVHVCPTAGPRTAVPPESQPHHRVQPTPGPESPAGGRPRPLPPRRAHRRAVKWRRPLPPLQCPPTELPRRPRPENQVSRGQGQAPILTGPGVRHRCGARSAPPPSPSPALHPGIPRRARTPRQDPAPGGLKTPAPGPAPRSLPQASTPFHLREEPPPGGLPGPGIQGPPRPPGHPTGGRETYTRRLGGQI